MRLGEREVEAELEETQDGLRVNIDGVWRPVGLQRLGASPRFVLTIENKIIEVLVQEDTQAINVQIASQTYEVETGRRSLGRPREHEAKFQNAKWVLLAPLSGVIVETRVAFGDTVQDGDVVAVIEAMKMLNDLQVKVSGIVSSIKVAEKQRVEIGQPLVEIEQAPEDESATETDT